MGSEKPVSRRDLLRARVRREPAPRPAPTESPEVIAARAEILGVAAPAPRALDDALGSPALPEVIEAKLTDAELDAMARQFAQSATIHQVLLRADRRDPSPAPAPSIDDAIDRLKSGQVRAIQLRYTFESQRWLDTLSRDAFGYRLIRVQDNTPPSPGDLARADQTSGREPEHE